MPCCLLPASFVWHTGAFVLIVAALLTQIAGGLCELFFSRPVADIDACPEVFITHTAPDVKRALRLITYSDVGAFMDSTDQIERFIFLIED